MRKERMTEKPGWAVRARGEPTEVLGGTSRYLLGSIDMHAAYK
jgi:hypothetical protein